MIAVVTALIFLILFSLLMSAVYSGSETGMYCMNRVRLNVAAREGDSAARRLLTFIADEHRALSTLLVGTNVFNYLVTISMAYLLVRLAGVTGRTNELYTTLIATPLIFVFGEVAPKALFERRSDPLMLRVSAIILASLRLFFVPVTMLGWISRPIIRWFDPAGIANANDPRRKVSLMLHDALTADDDESDKHRELIDGVLRLRSVQLHEVMTPRNLVISVIADGDRKACLAAARKSAHTRLCVYERNPRRIIGTVQVHRVLAAGDGATIRDHLEPTVQLSAHHSVALALVTMQQQRVRLAVVADRSGLLLGVVTLKDLLEELTGELHAW